MLLFSCNGHHPITSKPRPWGGSSWILLVMLALAFLRGSGMQLVLPQMGGDMLPQQR